MRYRYKIKGFIFSNGAGRWGKISLRNKWFNRALFQAPASLIITPLCAPVCSSPLREIINGQKQEMWYCFVVNLPSTYTHLYYHCHWTLNSEGKSKPYRAPITCAATPRLLVYIFISLGLECLFLFLHEVWSIIFFISIFEN